MVLGDFVIEVSEKQDVAFEVDDVSQYRCVSEHIR